MTAPALDSRGNVAPGIPRRVALVMFLCARWWAAMAQESGEAEVIFRGMANASAAVAIGTNQVLVADDDDNQLRLYNVIGGDPVRVFDWSGALRTYGRQREADLEAAARVGDRIYWLGSHSLANDGAVRLNRRRFFATDLTNDAQGVTLREAGTPCATLLNALLRSPQARTLGLVDAAGRAPDDGGINFEGLARRADGGLWIGVRSPLVKEDAILLPFLNPDDVLLAGAVPRFGEAVLLDLDGRGVRDLAFAGNTLYLIAGGAGEGRKSRLYRWKADEKKPKRIDISLDDFNAEAIAVFGRGASRRLLLLADEGGASRADGTFRGRWITP